MYSQVFISSAYVTIACCWETDNCLHSPERGGLGICNKGLGPLQTRYQPCLMIVFHAILCKWEVILRTNDSLQQQSHTQNNGLPVPVAYKLMTSIPPSLFHFQSIISAFRTTLSFPNLSSLSAFDIPLYMMFTTMFIIKPSVHLITCPKQRSQVSLAFFLIPAVYSILLVSVFHVLKVSKPEGISFVFWICSSWPKHHIMF